ncbi:MAG TPA: alanine--tRNA ligase, partial [Gemmatimonadaceae bacterium]|nr:alanine--tRNA ligase [Gemmatimonadaceae bacterium]
SEIYVDIAHIARDWAFPRGATGEWTELDREEFSLDAFVLGAEEGRFLEIWNFVFMQFDRQPDGALVPLPKPSVDTGAGLERISAVMQRWSNNFDTDVFQPLIEVAGAVVGTAAAKPEMLPSLRVLADHARAVAFLIADGVFPSNEGRGYVVRRILRRAVRHAWILGRREPTLVHVVKKVIEQMGGLYPELAQRSAYILDTTRGEEERFLATIEGGMARFDQIAPAASTQGSTALRGTISGEDAFRLYDTFGFPIDLTELMARERGYTVDIVAFERALGAQREQSREERKGRALAVADDLGDVTAWEVGRNGQADRPPAAAGEAIGATRFVGYDTLETESDVLAVRRLPEGRLAVVLRETPFYAESGGQISDVGELVGDGWRLDVDEVRKLSGRIATVGTLHGEFKFGRVLARVPRDVRRDTERNHTATHLLHAALRTILGEHVHQAGSLVAPDRLRFDFTHHGPLKPEQIDEIERWVNRAVWDDIPLRIEERPYQEAVAAGAMALFGEKYGDVVRVVSIPGLSMELCGGTHTRSTGQIGLFRIVSETGLAAGVRRITAYSGPRAFEHMREQEASLARAAELLKAPVDAVPRRIEALLEERRTLQRRLDESARGGGDQVKTLLSAAEAVNGARVVAAFAVAGDLKELQALGDALRERLGTGVGVLAAELDEGKHTILTVVTDDLRARGVRADEIVRRIAANAGGRGGGKPHMAQAGVADAARLADAMAKASEVVRSFLTGAA